MKNIFSATALTVIALGLAGCGSPKTGTGFLPATSTSNISHALPGAVQRHADNISHALPGGCTVTPDTVPSDCGAPPAPTPDNISHALPG